MRFSEQILRYLEQLLGYLKNTAIAVLSAFMTFLGPVADLIWMLLLLILLDLFTAIFAAERKEPGAFSSKKMEPTFLKFLLYFSVVLVAHFMDMFFVSNIRQGFLDSVLSFFIPEDTILKMSSLRFTSAVAFVMAIREAKSIDENWEKAFGWSFLKTFKLVFNYLTSFKSKFKLKQNGKTESTNEI